MSVREGDGSATCSTPTARSRRSTSPRRWARSSAHTWLKLPVVDELERVMDATDAADPAARRRPPGRPARHLRRVGQGPRRCRRCAAWSSAGPCSTRPTVTSPPPSTSPPSSCTASAPGDPMSDPDNRWVLPLGQRRPRRLRRRRRRPVRGLAAHRPAGRRPRRGRAGHRARRRLGVRRGAARRRRPRARDRPDGSDHEAELAGRPSVFAGPTDVAYRAGRQRPDPHRHRRRGPGRGVRRPGAPRRRERRPSGTWPRAEVPVELRGAGQRRRARCATSASPACSTPTRSSPARSSPRRATGAPTRRTSTTRSAPGSRPSSRRSTTSRPRSRARRRRRHPHGADPVGYQRVYGTDERPDRRPRRGPHRRRRAGAARLARAGDGGARLRPLLPQRDGRPRADPRLADLRRPQPRLGPRHLGRPGTSTPDCPLEATQR